MVCKKCGQEKEMDLFYKYNTSGCKSCLYVSNRERLKNKPISLDKKKIYNKSYREKNKEKVKKSQHKNYIENKSSILSKNKSYRDSHKESMSEYKRKYVKNRLKTDILYSIKCKIKNLIRLSIVRNGFKKSKGTEEILGVVLLRNLNLT